MKLPRTTRSSRTQRQLRIIGGRWRGRKLKFPDVDTIRPTPDRVRETVFNWLQTDVVDARCLDLFSGSGALGLEALSRGAAHVTFVDCERAIARYLVDTLQTLDTQAADVQLSDAIAWLKSARGTYRIVFLDPPFAAHLLRDVTRQLEQAELLDANALIYMECAASDGAPEIPNNWSLIKSKTAGQVGYHLARRKPIQA